MMRTNDDWRDAFWAKLEIGSLVTYAMKRDGGTVYPVARIVGQAPTGWLQVDFDEKWLNEYNAPFQKHVDEARAKGKRTDILENNLIKAKRRTVAPESLIRLDTHPSFAK